MAQKTVQPVIGPILTEENRATFLERPVDTFVSLGDQGYDLTTRSQRSYRAEMRLWQRGTKWIDALTAALPSDRWLTVRRRRQR